MQKTTFLTSYVNLIFFFISISFFAQDRSFELVKTYNKNDSYTQAKSESFKLNYKQTSPFVMLSGYTKNLSFSGNVYYRLKSKYNWGEWIIFPKPHDEDLLDRVSIGFTYIDDSFDEIQFKVDKHENSKFIFRLFFPEFTKNLKPNQKNIGVNNQVLARCTQPAFQGRNDWCPSGNCPKDPTPSANNPTHIVVHHSAGQTTSTDFAAVVRGYWDFHVNSNGWDDIGYNWLVDPNGVVYEGRGDRIRGAHSPCMNAISTGICLIGNYDDFQPSTLGLSALKNMIAWDATDKNINVLTSGYVAALNGNINHVSGHKDGYDQYPSAGCTNTACPGTNLHNKLQTIRNDVAAYPCYISNANAPSTPISFGVIRSGNNEVDIKISPVTNATKYAVYKSIDNISFQKVKESSSNNFGIENLDSNTFIYLKVQAINSQGNSDLSTPLAVVPSTYKSNILIVDGVERRTFESIKQYQFPVNQLQLTISSATNDAIQNGLINLNDFNIVIWMLLDESTADDTFNKTEQNKIKEYIDNKGVFIVTGNEIGWDLVEKGDATDKSFYENYLFAQYIADNPTPHNYSVIDNNNVTYHLDNSNNILNNTYPDLIKTKNGSARTFNYTGVNTATGYAGVSYKNGDGGVEYLGFALEGIDNDNERKQLLENILEKYQSQLATNEYVLNTKVSLYPNPTNGIINIQNPDLVKIKKVEIFTIFGQKISSTWENNQINLNHLSDGIYIVKIESYKGFIGVYKVIKK